MASGLTLTILGGSLFVATAIGVYLGESSVGMINPIHFQGPALHPRERGVAIEESELRQPVRTAYRDLYGWDEGRAARTAARAEDCGDCDALRARDAFTYSAVVPYFGGPAERQPGPAVEGPAPHDEPDVAQTTQVAMQESRVARYAHYPVVTVAEEKVEKIALGPVEQTW